QPKHRVEHAAMIARWSATTPYQERLEIRPLIVGHQSANHGRSPQRAALNQFAIPASIDLSTRPNRGIQRDWAGYEGQLQITLPLRTRGHWYSTQRRYFGTGLKWLLRLGFLSRHRCLDGKNLLRPLDLRAVCSQFVLMAVETLGEARDLGWRVIGRCAQGNRAGMKSIRECGYRAELDMDTLVWTWDGRSRWLGSRNACAAHAAVRARCPSYFSRRATWIDSSPVCQTVASWGRQNNAATQGPSVAMCLGVGDAFVEWPGVQ